MRKVLAITVALMIAAIVLMPAWGTLIRLQEINLTLQHLQEESITASQQEFRLII